MEIDHCVAGWLADGENIISLCERGDKLLEEEIAKVYKGKKIQKVLSLLVSTILSMLPSRLTSMNLSRDLVLQQQSLPPPM